MSGAVSPVLPTPGAAVRLRPIGLLGSHIQGGLWSERRRINRDVTIPHGAAKLVAAGNLVNFALAAGQAGSYRGGNDDSGTTAPFLDSDVYKWLEAVGWELAAAPDRALLALAEPMLELIAGAQRADGYIDTFFQVARPDRAFTELGWGHELYVAGHLVQAAVAWKRALGDDRLLRIASRFVARIETELGPGGRVLVCGHPEFEMALVELYRVTGEARLLELARTLIERRGHGILGPSHVGARYWQDHEPVRTASEPTGHAVRQMYLDCGVVDVAVETNDAELLQSAIRRWESMVSSRMYLTGGLGAHHRDEAFGDAYELPPDRAYAETCAAIGSVMLAWRLLLATGESRFADVIERTAFNAVLPAVALDGSHFFYSNPLMRRSAGIEILEGAATTRRASWFPVACCPPNLMRFLSSFPDLVATMDDGGIQVHQYATGSLEVPLQSGTVRASVSTGYPWDGDIQITIAETVAEPWTLSLRVAAWCERASFSVNEEDLPTQPYAGTLQLTRTWSAGDRVRLRLDMPSRVTLPSPRIDAVRGTLAIERGPIVYAVEDADLPDGRSVESLEVPASPEMLRLEESEPEADEMVWLSLHGTLRDAPAEPGWPYSSPDAKKTVAPSSPVTVRAVPYFAWGNRPGLGMRIWLPVQDREPIPAAEPHDSLATPPVR